MFAGTGVGGTIFPFVMSGLLDKFGYKAAMVSLVSALHPNLVESCKVSIYL